MKVIHPARFAGFIPLAFLCLVAIIVAKPPLAVAAPLIAPPAPPLPARIILVYGDSISAAFGMETHQGWVSLLAERLKQSHPHYRVINASVSGETTGGGVARLAKTLEIMQPDIFILELGGNDGLRGYPPERIQQNLEIMIQGARDAGAEVLLIGMEVRPNLGRRYVQQFTSIYGRLAERHQLDFVPRLLDGTVTNPRLLQEDGTHPTAEAQPLLLEDVWKHLAPMLD